jgi:CheY-like chemotaxis protein
VEEQEILFVVSEDDDDDFFMIEKAIDSEALKNFRTHRVHDGEALLDFLNGQVTQKGPVQPMMVLLDLNMPKKDGRQALKEIKASEKLKKIPILVLTTSEAKEDIHQSYMLGANAYFIKPSSFKEFQQMLQTIGSHWFKFARLPA